MKQNNDLSLVSQVAEFHDRAAFDRLVVKYQSPIRRFFLHQTLGDVQLSDDLAQDTFVKAYTHIRDFHGTSSFSTWLMRIAYNTYYDHCRTHHPTVDLESVSCQSHSTYSDTMIRKDIYEALSQLSEVQRTCITMQLIDGRPIDEIADITGMPQGTVKSHLKRGKDQMVSFLKQNGY